MKIMRLAPAAIALLVAATPSFADRLDVLKGKFAFDWHSNSERTRCVKIGDKMMAELRSAKYRCDLTVVSNTTTGAAARVCTKVGGGGEYLIFDTRRSCDGEREAQSANE